SESLDRVTPADTPGVAIPDVSAACALTPEAVIAVQRLAGNRATSAWLDRKGSVSASNRGRTLSRCPGVCTCGGKCANEAEDEELLASIPRLLRAAVLQRSAGNRPASYFPRKNS